MHIAKWIIALIAVAKFGGFVAGALVPATAKQHLWNPRWPPHAKFHNSQMMLMGIFGGALALSLLFGSSPLSLRSLPDRGSRRFQLLRRDGLRSPLPGYRLDGPGV